MIFNINESKTITNNNTIALFPNTAHNYIYESMYDQYLSEKIYQENRLIDAINKTIAVTESAPIEANKLTAIYEAKIGDKIKSTWKKFIAFVKNLFAKFMESMTNLVLKEKDYLEKYKDIIKGKKGNPDIKFSYTGDYERGVQRIIKTKLEVFDYSKFHEALEQEGEQAIVKQLIPDLEYNDTDTLAEQLKEYFICGDEGEKSGNFSQLNFTTMYNFCYDFKNVEAVINKDINYLESSTNAIEKAIENKIKENGNKQTAPATNPDESKNVENGNQQTASAANPDESKNVENGNKPTSEHAVYSHYNSFVNEATIDSDKLSDPKYVKSLIKKVKSITKATKKAIAYVLGVLAGITAFLTAVPITVIAAVGALIVSLICACIYILVKSDYENNPDAQNTINDLKKALKKVEAKTTDKELKNEIKKALNKLENINESVLYETNNAEDKPASKTNLNIDTSNADTTRISKVANSYNDRSTVSKDTLANNANAVGDDKKVEDIWEIVNKWKNVCNSIISAKLTAINQIAKDYMDMIRTHVRSYVGKEADKSTDTPAKQGAKYSNNNQTQNKSTQGQQAQQQGQQAQQQGQQAQ